MVSTMRVMCTGLPSWLHRLMMRFCSSAMTCGEWQLARQGEVNEDGALLSALAHDVLLSSAIILPCGETAGRSIRGTKEAVWKESWSHSLMVANPQIPSRHAAAAQDLLTAMWDPAASPRPQSPAPGCRGR